VGVLSATVHGQAIGLFTAKALGRRHRHVGAGKGTLEKVLLERIRALDSRFRDDTITSAGRKLTGREYLFSSRPRISSGASRREFPRGRYRRLPGREVRDLRFRDRSLQLTVMCACRTSRRRPLRVHRRSGGRNGLSSRADFRRARAPAPRRATESSGESSPTRPRTQAQLSDKGSSNTRKKNRNDVSERPANELSDRPSKRQTAVAMTVHDPSPAIVSASTTRFTVRTVSLWPRVPNQRLHHHRGRRDRLDQSPRRPR